jgi:AcrR family transcriptional regulator
MAGTGDVAGAGRDARGRGGRPPRNRAGEVEARILDAAGRLFLARGFEGTSCDEVAALARAGKASIYARYPNKEALFAAVVGRVVAEGAPPPDRIPPELPLRDRLVAAGAAIVERALTPEALALMRLVIAEAARFPALASRADATGRGSDVRRVAEVIACRSASADAVERATAPAASFVELVLVPLQMRALLGGDLAGLRRGVARRLEAAVAMLAAAGALDGWS